jgi:hypothetical protein
VHPLASSSLKLFKKTEEKKIDHKKKNVSNGLTLLLFTAPQTSAKFAATTDVLHMNITAKENKILKIARSIQYTTKNQTIRKTPNQSKIAHYGVSIENRKKPHVVLHRKLKKLTRKPASL